MSEPLDSEVVYSNLEWEWTWRGLTWQHIFLCFAPAFLYLTTAAWLEFLPMAAAVHIFLASVPAVMVLQYRQGRDWIVPAVQNAFLPRFLDHRRHVPCAPFPVAREELCRRP